MRPFGAKPPSGQADLSLLNEISLWNIQLNKPVIFMLFSSRLRVLPVAIAPSANRTREARQ
jgi:hypothetical protein